MNILKTMLFFALLLVLPSCRPGKIRVQNNISNVKIVDVKWGDFYLATELLPGESSRQISVTQSEENFPGSHQIVFKMSANGKLVYLQTKEVFMLDHGDDLLITLRDDTAVSNPNGL